MNILNTDWGHWIAIVGVLISIGMDAFVAVMAWQLLRWHRGNGVRLAALEAWQVLEAVRATRQELASHGRRATDKQQLRRRATDRVDVSTP